MGVRCAVLRRDDEFYALIAIKRQIRPLLIRSSTKVGLNLVLGRPKEVNVFFFNYFMVLRHPS